MLAIKVLILMIAKSETRNECWFPKEMKSFALRFRQQIRKYIFNVVIPDRGKMLMSVNPMGDSLKPLMPFEDNTVSECTDVDDVVQCFKAGTCQ